MPRSYYFEKICWPRKELLPSSVSGKTSDISCCVVPLDHECCIRRHLFFIPLRTYDPLPLRDDSILLFCYVEIMVRLRVTRVKLNRGSVRLLVS